MDGFTGGYEGQPGSLFSTPTPTPMGRGMGPIWVSRPLLFPRHNSSSFCSGARGDGCDAIHVTIVIGHQVLWKGKSNKKDLDSVSVGERNNTHCDPQKVHTSGSHHFLPLASSWQSFSLDERPHICLKMPASSWQQRLKGLEGHTDDKAVSAGFLSSMTMLSY